MRAHHFAWMVLVNACLIWSNVSNIIAQRQMERLDRGVVAIKVGNGVFISWRVFGNEYLNTSYNLYRESTLLNDESISGATNYLDTNGTIGSTYSVAAVVDGIEQSLSDPVGVWNTNYLQIPLQRPAGGTTPDGVSYTYNANDCSVGDLDGDGQYEIVLKWDPTNSHDNAHEGYTGNVFLDAYELDGTRLWRINLGINIRAGAHYTQFMVYDLDGDGKAEVACKTADGTTDGQGTVIGNANADYRNSSGRILSGPEFLTVFNGETGAILQTVDYVPPRESVSSWGDNYGNRVDRFLACIAYLDGQRPSLVMCRGYYLSRTGTAGKTILAAWDYRNSALTPRWTFTAIKGSENDTYTGQGNHNLSVADVDEDGKDEIIYGACAIDDNGSGLWTTGLGHGDAMHVSDIDPGRPGLEKWGIHEGTGNPGSALLDARTGQILWQTPNADIGRGVSADLTASFPGMECWGGTGGLRSATGQYAGESPVSSNFVIWWDGDDLRELLDDNYIDKYNTGRVLTASGCSSNNGSKSTPGLSADLLGDWREEVIFRTTDNSALRLYVSTSITQRRMYTLMHDPHYRLSIAWQNVAYNQPPHTGFYLGDGMGPPPPPPISEAKLRWSKGNTWDIQTSKNWMQGDTLSCFNNGDDVLFDLSGSNSDPIALDDILTPARVTVFAPQDYTFDGPGSLSGTMGLLKAGSGTLTINSNSDYSGKTMVWQGSLMVNGSLSQSTVEVYNSASVGGGGVLGKGVKINPQGKILVGEFQGSADTLWITDHLTLAGEVTMCFDLSDDSSGMVKTNDIIMIDGEITMTGTNTIDIHLLDGSLQEGHYTLIRYTGAFTGDLNEIRSKGLESIPYELENTGNAILLKILDLRDPARIIWTGDEQSKWDLATSLNWLNNGTPDWFVSNDTVLFNDSGDPNTSVNLVDLRPLIIGRMIVNASVNYTFDGVGSIGGAGGIIKSGTGKLGLLNQNNYTGSTLVNEGILEIPGMKNAGQASPVGAATADPANLVINGGILNVTGATSYTNRGMTLGLDGATLKMVSATTNLNISGEITGNGKLVKTGKGILTLSAANSYTGGTLISDGEVCLGNDDANINGLGTGTVTIKNGTLSMFDNNNSDTEDCNWDIIIPEGANAGLNLDSRCSLTGTLTGSGTLNLYTPWIRSELDGDWSGFSGKINVTTDSDGGSFLVSNQKGFSNATIALSDKVTVLYTQPEDAVVEIGALSGTASSTLGGGEGVNAITWIVGTNNTDAAFHGLISNQYYRTTGTTTSVIKAGTGNWTLTHANTYSGTTVVNGGILTLNNASGSGTGTGTVTVNQGASIRGNGSVDGTLTVAGQSSLSVGYGSETGTFTVKNDAIFQPGSYLAVKIDPVLKSCDTLVVTGNLTLGGFLYITKLGLGDYAAGDSYKILDAGNVAGHFEMVLPTSPGEGLVWDITFLYSHGFIQVLESMATHDVEDKKSGIKVYPNPAGNMIRILVEDAKLTDPGNNAVLRCYDDQGRLIWQDRLVSIKKRYETEIDLSGLPGGIYILIVTGDEYNYVKRFIKQ